MMYNEVVKEFALRTRKNLEAVEKLQGLGADVYEVTQLINSMLGLLVFPQQEFVESIPATPLHELEFKGWPIPKVVGDCDQVVDLNQLVRYLRNAVAHFNIEFIGDGEHQIRVLRVWNMAPKRDARNQPVRDVNRKLVEVKNWEAELTVDQLRGIAIRFIDLLLQ